MYQGRKSGYYKPSQGRGQQAEEAIIGTFWPRCILYFSVNLPIISKLKLNNISILSQEAPMMILPVPVERWGRAVSGRLLLAADEKCFRTWSKCARKVFRYVKYLCTKKWHFSYRNKYVKSSFL